MATVTESQAEDGTIVTRVELDPERHAIKASTRDADVTIYMHHPTNGGTPHLVIDIDTEYDRDQPEVPMTIYRNDEPIHEEV